MINRHWYKEVALLLFCIAIFLILITPANTQAAVASYNSIEQVNTEVLIKKDGLVQVNHDLSYNTNSNYLYWAIPSTKVDSIEIKQQDRIIFPQETRKEDGNTIVFWKSPETSSGFGYNQQVSIKYQLPASIDMAQNREKIQIVLFKELGIEIEKANIIVSFEGQAQDIKQRFYAIHGIEQAEFISEQDGQYQYQALDLSEYAIFSVDFSFPKGSLEISAIDKIKNWLNSLSIETALLISFLIPLLVFLFLFTVYRNHVYTKDIKGVTGCFSKPPAKLSPLLVETLYRNKITAQGIGALVIQLLSKGYLTIIDKPDGAIIGKIKEPDQNLTKFEKLMIKVLFQHKQIKGGMKELRYKKSQDVFNQTVSQLYSWANYTAAKEHYFAGDASKTRGKIFRQGIGLFFLAIILIIFFLLYLPSSPWLALAPASLIIAALMIIRMRSIFTVRSPQGQRLLVNWLKFKNYLSQDCPTANADQSIYEQYLPWAFLFNTTNEWLAKFKRYPLAKPKWFATNVYGITPEAWTKKTITLVDKLANEIIDLKSPEVS